MVVDLRKTEFEQKVGMIKEREDIKHIWIEYKCKRCGHEWVPRKQGRKPKSCPNCKSYNWNKDIKEKENKSSTTALMRLEGELKEGMSAMGMKIKKEKEE